MHRSVSIPLYLFSDDQLVRWVDRCREVIAESDSGAPELYPVIETLQGEYFDRLSTVLSLTDDGQIVAEKADETAH